MDCFCQSTIERVSFSAVASNNDNFRPMVGMPYSGYLSNANGSLTVSSEYGSQTYSPGTITSEKGNIITITQIKVYPNPTEMSVHMDLSKEITLPLELKVLNIEGKLIKQLTVKEINNTLDLSDYPTGTYLLNFTDNKKRVGTFRILKNK